MFPLASSFFEHVCFCGSHFESEQIERMFNSLQNRFAPLAKSGWSSRPPPLDELPYRQNPCVDKVFNCLFPDGRQVGDRGILYPHFPLLVVVDERSR